MSNFDFDIIDPYTKVSDMMKLVPVSMNRKNDIFNAFLQPGRLYHNTYHIASMWALHEYMTSVFNHHVFSSHFLDRKIASAILYHDAIHDPKSKTNEEDSANLWLNDNEEFNLLCDSETKKWVRDAILATKTHVSEDALIDWFIGLDLASIGAPWDVFQNNFNLVRFEYRHQTDAEFYYKNNTFLRGLLDRPMIYKDLLLRQEFEEQARINIARHLGQ